MHKQTRIPVLILLSAMLISVSGCFSSPVGTIKAYWRAIQKGDMEKALSYWDIPGQSAADVQGQFSIPGYDPSDNEDFLDHITISLLESSGEVAKVRCDFDYGALDAGEEMDDIPLGLEGISISDIMDMFKVVDFSLAKRDGKWKITMVDLPNMYKYMEKLGAGMMPGGNVMQGGKTW